ncbi:hypothetical protein PHMEG_00034944 [Phytophthora megakarya]|uniref:Uncharacterized protein n=1 Tax=Phytophthora megakarya TaxID=4795 RepID=A0A225UQ28_9STRA|nr:hypothetical protein PHMEG_00034944 [Phytophthora megakarya]
MKQGVEIFDSADSTIIPFEYRTTSQAIDKLMLMEPDTYDFQEVTTDSATVKYEVTYRMKDEIAKFQVYSVVRKYEEAERVVFVWRAFTEGQGNLSGYHTDETGWLSVRPGDNTTACKSTIIEVYTRFVPFGIGKTADENVNTDRFANIVAKSGEEEVNEMGRMLEKLLLGETKPSQGTTILI